MYLRIINDTITYPYSIQKLREDNPNVSFPAEMSDSVLEEWGMYDVVSEPYPTDYTKDVNEGTPTLIDGVYHQNWVLTDATTEEINYRIENKWFEIRELRNQLLQECDWTQLGDVPSETKELWQTYRQSLRDITSQSNPFNITWPVKP